MLGKKSLSTVALLSSLVASHAAADVVISGTRVVFPSNEREVTVKITNEGKAPALVQSWLDKGDPNASPDNIDVPFTMTPAMFRMEPGKGQTLRMIYSNEPLPADKESLFWLNVLEIPPKAAPGDDRNHLQIAFRSRIKVMFRPEGLAGSPSDAPKQLSWRIVKANGANGGYALQASNPTPYVVNLGSVALRAAGQKYDAGSGYVLPGATQQFPIHRLGTVPPADAKAVFGSIDDWGASTDNEQPVSMTH
ncbi:pilus assembly protein [Burkholderia ubonensis]|uniref:fimbrial biogenesis chaperone n=1 Tax=Burkholderia ubonensis TaxID=101571 RepID=UPI00075488E2|nr:fimbria/pilus periplasmic chaperone [Burkholderia ubonensis]KVN88569.1 pilus assembly protein [Burkholderia ubonensis]KVO17442.1 pilus assembly protein [Burkholderia ubonensis]KVO91371.1 pilus assembly protein [Burkholderia ubonensis]KVT61191.1 pilus assembly protein [Burkholderia ubonensis]KVT75998.1 pilus assembly protein [Burkholderia ubonensis]